MWSNSCAETGEEADGLDEAHYEKARKRRTLVGYFCADNLIFEFLHEAAGLSSLW